MTLPYFGFGGSHGKKDRVRQIPADSAGIEKRYTEAVNDVRDQRITTRETISDAQRGRSGVGGRTIPDNDKDKQANNELENLGRKVEKAASLQDSVRAVRRPRK